jgi:hypothetical protein
MYGSVDECVSKEEFPHVVKTYTLSALGDLFNAVPDDMENA